MSAAPEPVPVAVVAAELRSVVTVLGEQPADEHGFVEVGPSLVADALRWMTEAADRLAPAGVAT